MVTVNPRLAGYRTNQLSLLYRRIQDSVANVPGVSSSALCLYTPQMGGARGAAVWVEGHPPPRQADDFRFLGSSDGGVLVDVIGTPIVKGRGITAQDRAGSRKIAVVDGVFSAQVFQERRSNRPAFRRHGKASAPNSLRWWIRGKTPRYLTFHPGEVPEPFLSTRGTSRLHTKQSGIVVHE